MTCGACKAVEIYPYESLLFTCHCDLLLFLYFTPFLTYVFHVICIRGYPYAIPYHRYSPDELLSVVTTTFYQLRVSRLYTSYYLCTYGTTSAYLFLS